MTRWLCVGFVVCLAWVGSTAEPRPEAVPTALPTGAIRHLGEKLEAELPQARWPEFRFSTDGKTVTRIGGNTAITWDVSTGKETGRILPDELLTQGSPGIPLIADIYPRKLAARSPDGKTLISYSNPTVQQMQFQLTLKSKGIDWPDTGLTQRMVGVLQLAYTPDGRFAVAQLDQEMLHIWDLTAEPSAGNSIIFATPGPSGQRQVPLMHLAPDSKQVALVERDPKLHAAQLGNIRGYRWQLGVYDLPTRSRKSVVSGAGVLTGVEWSRDARTIAGCGRRESDEPGKPGGFAFVANTLGEFVMAPLELLHPATACALSPDGRMLAVGINSEVQVYEVRTGKLRTTFRPGSREIGAVKFHPSGRSLLSESRAGPVLLWDVLGEREPRAKLRAADWDRLWGELDSDDAAIAFRAIRTFSTNPEDGLAELQRRVKHPKRPAAEEINRLVEQLGSRLYAERQAAEKELRAMGGVAHPALRAALVVEGSPERHTRATRLLASPNPLAAVRVTRTVEVVEWIGTPTAQDLLTRWTNEGGPDLVAEAVSARNRLRK